MKKNLKLSVKNSKVKNLRITSINNEEKKDNEINDENDKKEEIKNNY